MHAFLIVSFDIDEDADNVPSRELMGLIDAFRHTVANGLKGQIPNAQVSVTIDEADVASLSSIEDSIRRRTEHRDTDDTATEATHD